jgi:hypothetical protein
MVWLWTVIANLKLYYTKISVAEGLNLELHFLFSIKNNENKTYRTLQHTAPIGAYL